MMKKIISVVVFIISITATGFSQESTFYLFFVNIISEPFRFPLIGLVNIANGNHDKVQLGLVNWNTGNFTGLQAGLANSAGGNISGVQLGLVNTSAGNINGWQSGLVNTVANGGQGFQFGLVNASMEKLKGVQLGLINYVESIEDGVPIGLISIVKNGGYRAVEYSFSEFYPTTIGLKLGVEKFYSTIFCAYSPSSEFDSNDLAIGSGFGSIISISETFFFNPELNFMSSTIWTILNGNTQNFISFIPYFGYKINKNFCITLGPSLTWINGDNGSLKKPLFKISHHKINENNSLITGVRASFRLAF